MYEIIPYFVDTRTIQQHINIATMKQYIGILVMLLGALLQLFTYFSDQVESANIFLGTGLVLVIVGYLLHIFLSKKNA